MWLMMIFLLNLYKGIGPAFPIKPSVLRGAEANRADVFPEHFHPL